MHCQKRILAAAVAAALFAIGAGAAQADEYTTLAPVKVTASRVEQELKDVNMSVSVITQEEIRESNARTVGELLENVPGVRINNDGGQGIKRVKIRGESAFHTLVMIDGQKIGEQKSMSGSPLLISPSEIERIEVIKGPASVLYGSEAIGGAINIITKKGGTKPIGGELSAGMNTSASGKSASGSVYGSTNGWNYRLSASVEDDGELKTPAGDMFNTYFTSRAASGFVSYDITADAQVGGRLEYYDLEFGSSDVSGGYPYFTVDVPKWERYKAGVFAEVKNISDNLVRVRTDAFYQRGNKSMANTIGTSNGRVPNSTSYVSPLADNKLNQYGFSVQTDWRFGQNHYLIAGYEFNYDDLDATSQMWMLRSPGVPLMKVTDKNYDGYQMTNAVFASMETTLPFDLTANYGVRYTWVKSEMDQVTWGMRSGTASKSFPSLSDGKAVFNFGLLWNGIDDLTLRAAYSQGYQFPLLQNLYIDTAMGTSSSTTLANPDLKPETSDNFELGARWSKHGVELDATTFYSDADDYIAVVALTGGTTTQYQNIAKAKTWGLEMSASWEIDATGFEPYANLTWMRRQFNHNGMKTFKSGTPDFYGRYGVRWTGEYNGLGLRTDVYGFTQTAMKTLENNDPDKELRYGGATTFNMTAGVSFGPEKQYSLDAGFYNIFDKKYQNEGSIYEPGRYFSIKMNARF